jgi:hypothetical protein
MLSFYSRQPSRMRSDPVPLVSRFPSRSVGPRWAAPRDAGRLLRKRHIRFGSATEACQAKAAKIAHTDQCTVGAGVRASRRMIALGHASRLVDFVGVPPALLLESKNPSRSTFSTRAL